MFICVYGTLCQSASLKYLFLRVLVSLVSVLLIEKCITCPQLEKGEDEDTCWSFMCF